MLAQEARTAPSAGAAEVQFAHGGPRPAPGTLTRLFFDAVRQFDKPNAMIHKVGGVWTPIPHRTVLERVRRIALGLQELGVARGDRVGILAENRPEWAMADYGCLTIGAASVPIYPTLPGEQIPHLLNDSGAAVVFVSTAAQAAKLRAIRGQCAGLRHVIGIDAGPADGCDLTLAELEARGAAAEDAERNARWEREALAVRPDDLATLIYTSGTTGTPKGVMLRTTTSTPNVVADARASASAADDVALQLPPALARVRARGRLHVLVVRHQHRDVAVHRRRPRRRCRR
jgi:long-chain acyl-CoA synthetase